MKGTWCLTWDCHCVTGNPPTKIHTSPAAPAFCRPCLALHATCDSFTLKCIVRSEYRNRLPCPPGNSRSPNNEHLIKRGYVILLPVLTRSLTGTHSQLQPSRRTRNRPTVDHILLLQPHPTCRKSIASHQARMANPMLNARGRRHHKLGRTTAQRLHLPLTPMEVITARARSSRLPQHTIFLRDKGCSGPSPWC